MRLHVIADPSVVSPHRPWEAALDGLVRAMRSFMLRSRPSAPATPAGAARPQKAPSLYLHIRAKEGPRSRWADARRRTHALEDVGVPVIFHGTLDDARAFDFHGVHWPEALIPSRSTPRPPHTLVGASVHSLAALTRAERADVNYVFFSPIFSPTSKPVPGRGLKALANLVEHAEVPVIALGGITAERCSDCLNAGAAGVAVLGGIFGQPNSEAAFRSYLAALSKISSRG